MSANKRVPKELQRYVVVAGNRANYECKYFATQKEAKCWAKKNQAVQCRLFRVDYDYYGELS